VDDLLPELANRRVLRSLDAELDDTVPSNRPITLEGLLTFRLGFGNVLAAPNSYPIQRTEAELRLATIGQPWSPTPHTPDEWIRLFGTLPLMHQPREQWMYNTVTQVLGVLLERAAAKPLEEFLRERIFDPLGMHDTGFSVSRMANWNAWPVFQSETASRRKAPIDSVAAGSWAQGIHGRRWGRLAFTASINFAASDNKARVRLMSPTMIVSGGDSVSHVTRSDTKE